MKQLGVVFRPLNVDSGNSEFVPDLMHSVEVVGLSDTN